MLKQILAGVAVAVMLAGTAMAGPWEDGVAAYKRGDYGTALRLWRPLAERGDPRAENNLGVIYENGLGVVQDDAEALKWYRLAAAHGHAEAKNNLSDLSAAGRSANELALAGPERWVVIASRQILDEAIDIARRYSRQKSRVIRAQNGWYAVILGPYTTSGLESFRRGYAGPRLPSDTFLSRGTNYVETVWPVPAGSSAKVATTKDWVDCTQLADADLAIRGCSTLIDARGEKGKNLADAYFNRGNAYYMKSSFLDSMYDPAIADYNTAIKLVPNFAVAYANRGVAYIYKHEYDRAIADYDKAIQIDPDFAAAYYGRGVAHHLSGEYARTFADYDKAIKLGPDDFSTPLLKLMESAFWNDDLDDDLDKFIKLDPGRSVAYLVRSFAKLRDKASVLDEDHFFKDLDIADLDKAIKLDPSLALPYLFRGYVNYDNGNANHAIADFDRAINLEPVYADAYRGRGKAYGDKGEYDRALADFNKANQLKLYRDFFFTGQFLAYGTKGDIDRAVADLDKAIKLNPNDAVARFERGAAYRHKGDYERAITDFKTVVRLISESAPINARAVVRIAELERKIASAKSEKAKPSLLDYWTDCKNSSNYNRAVRGCTNVIQIGKKQEFVPAAYYYRGRAHDERGRLEKALADYKEASDAIPNSDSLKKEARIRVVEIRKKLAPAKAKKSAEDKARLAGTYCSIVNRPASERIRNCNRAISSNRIHGNDLAILYRKRGLAYSDQHSWDKAIGDYSKAIKINPKYALAYYHRGRAYDESGKLEKALADFKVAVRLGFSIAKVRARIAEIESELAPPSSPKVIAKPAPSPPPSAKVSPTPSAPEDAASSGTGIVVATNGRVLTNNHVIDECQEYKVRRTNDAPMHAVLLSTDKSNDLALLKIDDQIAERDVAAIRIGPRVRNGEDIAVYGFPLAGVLSSSGNVTRGNISALSGLGDDVNFFQLTAPIQPGNSGGPLLDQSGNVIGVVNSKLNELAVAKETGSLPQSVNFAIKANIVRSFLEAHNVNYRTASGGDKLDLPSIADIARRFTVHVVCR